MMKRMILKIKRWLKRKEAPRKLKACPFCGEKTKLVDLGDGEDDHYYMAECQNEECSAATCFGEVDKERFVARWNRRVRE